MKSGFLLIVIVLSLMLYSESHSEINLGFIFGFSTPNNHVNDIYNSSIFHTENGLGKLWRDASSAGYHFGVKARLQMNDNADFLIGIYWHRFMQSDLKLLDTAGGKELTSFSSKQNVIPINVGVSYYLLKSTLSLYITGDLAYNYISSSVDYKGIPIEGVSITPTDSRVGWGIGAGFDLDLGSVAPNLEVKYNIINLIGKVGEEQTKAFLSVSLGFYF